MTSLPDPLDHRIHTLGNGLRLVLHRDPSLPLVAINLWVHVGSKHEGPGQSGFAHLFEHMLFQGSEHVGTNDHFRYVQQAGGVANGSTWYDRTNYFETLPSHQLDLGLWLESDRMGFLLPALTQEKLDLQRQVVINERRQRVDNQPYGRAFERLQELLYPPGHPYRHPVIGTIEDLEGAGLDDVRSFFRTFYVPNNTVLTLAGDIDEEDALQRVERYFSELPRGAEVGARPCPPLPKGERREVMPDDVRLPRIYASYPIPAYGREPWYAADLLATALSFGKSSILYQELVHRRQLAQDVTCFVYPTEEASAFVAVATASPTAELERLAEALDDHLDSLAVQTIDPSHLERARNQLLTDYLNALQPLEQRADLFSKHTTLFDDPARITVEPRQYLQPTVETMRDVAHDHLRRDRRAVVTVVPKEGG